SSIFPSQTSKKQLKIFLPVFNYVKGMTACKPCQKRTPPRAHLVSVRKRAPPAAGFKFKEGASTGAGCTPGESDF
ncbi:MAG: hypothetical protein JSW39_18050, partial [Desulfobacterales bacterium]